MSFVSNTFLTILIISLGLSIGKLHEDPSSLSNYHSFRQIFLNWDLEIDFENKEAEGKVEFFFTIEQNEKILILDTRKLTILKVESSKREELKFHLEKENDLGSALHIELQSEAGAGGYDSVVIHYKINKDSPAIHFIDPEHTSNGEFPMLFTNCELSKCRGLVPLQDTSVNQFVVQIRLKVPKNLTPYFSGTFSREIPDPNFNIHEFKSSGKTVSSHMGFVVGRFFKRQIGNRFTILSDRGDVDNMAWEFDYLYYIFEKFEVFHASKFDFGEYNLFFMPKYFPFDPITLPGMSLVPITLANRNKANIFLLAKEIAKSYCGVSVSSINWRDYWINESFALYGWRKILSLLQEEDIYPQLQFLGNLTFSEELRKYEINHDSTALHQFIGQESPEKFISAFAVEKGFNFLRYLETIILENNFQEFISHYVQINKGKQIDWEDFREFFASEIRKIYRDSAHEQFYKVNWNEWINGRGLPKYMPEIKSKKVDEVKELINKLLEGKSTRYDHELFKNWPTQVQIIFFKLLRQEPEKINYSVLNEISLSIKTDEITNPVVLIEWLLLTLESGTNFEYKKIIEFVKNEAKLSWIAPLFKLFFKQDKVLALKIFLENKGKYHPIVQEEVVSSFKTLDKEYKWTETKVNKIIENERLKREEAQQKKNDNEIKSEF